MRQGPLSDLNNILPRSVWPTPLRVLVQNGELLVIRQYEDGDEILEGHACIWRTLSRLDGVTVVCVWGGPGARTRLTEYVNGHAQEQKQIETSTFRDYVRWWWDGASRL